MQLALSCCSGNSPSSPLPTTPAIPNLMYSSDMLAILIGEIYLEKISADVYADSAAAGGLVGNRKDLEAVVYDFFLSRYGRLKAAANYFGSTILL